jgi:hypothetical protein
LLKNLQAAEACDTHQARSLSYFDCGGGARPVIRVPKNRLSKILCHASQNFPKEKVKAGSEPDG